jgi:hypothetical protein
MQLTLFLILFIEKQAIINRQNEVLSNHFFLGGVLSITKNG